MAWLVLPFPFWDFYEAAFFIFSLEEVFGAASFLNTTVLSKTSTNTGCDLSISPANIRLLS
jgi:hypothetical protein